ncbi:NAD(P)H-dependent oxidoreductase [Propylenella binzhouense]|uniref:Flavodoxin family protein n=1 Tax=Propylenella binzhouense TaxID=2555902 RepID=A0A964T204_9HYPH|nr:NAD(P)H-dependent oxidoreductase [Propylenella binzhouense]MYZ46936.1 flavodoxin family protein [Propylenella binzhouense]
MAKRICIIQGHPDPRPERFCRALGEAYRKGAEAAGHEVRQIDVASLAFPLLRTQADWEHAAPPDDIVQAQDNIGWAEHLVFVYPLWLGAMPALLKGFLEQALRPGFAVSGEAAGTAWTQRLKGRSARIVVTMGMPALVYRWYFGAHSLKSFERNILKFCGIRPVRESLVGMVAAKEGGGRTGWLAKMEELGSKAL